MKEESCTSGNYSNKQSDCQTGFKRYLTCDYSLLKILAISLILWKGT